jgi:stage II sporulation protein D
MNDHPPLRKSLYFTLFILLLFCSESVAGESIRVAVREGQPTVKISSNATLRIKDAQGRLLASEEMSSVLIKAVEKGFMVNDLLVKAPLLKIASPQNDLEAEGQPLRGLIEVRKKGKGLIVINELDIEDYLKGVVPEEVAYDWHPEALKVQAIVARTYALYQKRHNSGRGFDLVSTVQDQVYQGVGTERPETSMAVAMTDGLVVTYGNELALTLYHSTSAGPTQDIREVWGRDFPYLRGVDCPFDESSPYYRWEKKIPLQRFEDSLTQSGLFVGSLATFTPYLWTSSGRVKEVRVLHSRGELFLKGEEIRKIVGYRVLPSTRFDVVAVGRDIILRGKGYGHGIGLCQWGTKIQSEQGKSFLEILRYYYPGVQVRDYRTLSIVHEQPHLNSSLESE